MTVKRLSVLLIEGNARQVLVMAKSIRELGHEVTTYNSSKSDFGYASRYPHRKLIRYFSPEDERKSIETFINELKQRHYDLIIPMNDDAAILLSKYKKQIEEHSSVAVNDWDIFKLSMDKLETMKVCMANEIPCPITLNNPDNINQEIRKLKFPVVVKPRVGCGAVGFHVSPDEDDLIKYYDKARKKYGDCLIQEYIPQTDLQYKAELYIDREGKLKSAIVFAKVRWYPTNGGSSTLNKTVERPDIIESCHRLLKEIGWKGYADIDLIQDPRDNTAKIIEINPRITGSVKICFKAGVNFSRQIIEDHLELPVTSIFDYRKDIYLRYLQKDILWLLKAPNRFKSSPNWFSFKDNTDQIFDIKDPMPFFVSAFYAVPKLLQDLRKRKV